MTLWSKLLLAQIPLAIALVAIGLFSLRAVSTLGKGSQVILAENYSSIQAAERMKKAAERMDSGALFRLMGEEEAGRQLKEKHRPEFERQLKIQEANITEPGEKEVTMRLAARWEAYQRAYDRWERIPDLERRRAAYFAELAPGLHALEEAADEVQAINQKAMVRKSDRADEEARRLGGLGFLLLLGSMILGGSTSAVLTRRALRPLSRLAQAARRIGEGDLQMRVMLDGKDEVAQLGTEFNSMAEKLNQYRRTSLGDLLKAQLEMQAAIDSIPDPVVFAEADGTLTNANRSAIEVLGLDPALKPDEMSKKVPSPIQESLERLSQQVLSGKGAYVPKGFDDAVRAALPDGDRHFLPRATPLYGERGEIAGVTVMFQDVTRLRRFDELKNDIVATVAHEFRTPLTSLQMAVHLCVDQKAGPLTETQADLLYAAREDCARLRVLVEELLDLSRIHTGRVEMHRQRVAVKELFEGVIAQHKVAADEHSLRLSAEPVLPGLEGFLDRTRIALVLSNLVGNALRHTSEGGQVILRARQNDGLLRFEVEDTGEGIPAEYQDRIFDKFFQVPGARVGGSGLGLTIAKEIVRAHDGEIGVKSEVGKGSCFWFTIPSPPAGSASS